MHPFKYPEIWEQSHFPDSLYCKSAAYIQPSPFRNNVGRSAGIEDRVMHTGIFQQMFPQNSMPWKDRSAESKALFPFVRAHGSMAFYAVESHVIAFSAIQRTSTQVFGAACIISAMSMSRKQPFLS